MLQPAPMLGVRFRPPAPQQGKCVRNARFPHWRLCGCRYDCGNLPARNPARIPHSMYVRQYRDGWRCEVQRNGQRLSKTFPTKRAAQAWGIEQEARSESLGKGWRTFEQATAEYLERVSSRKRSQQWEANTFARLAEHFGAATPLGEIDEAAISRWRDDRLKTVSGSTVQREANLLRNLFTVARDEWKWVAHSPFKGVKLPDHNAPRRAVWTWRLIRRVLRSGRGGKTGEVVAAFRVALATGMRLSEVLSAKLEGRVAVLPRDKTTSEPVKVPLTRRGVRAMQRAPRYTVGANEASALFSKLLDSLLIEGLTFHDSRASALTWLSRRVDVMTLARISRHRDLRILQNTYYRETAEQIAARL